jgi:hypothetical protein
MTSLPLRGSTLQLGVDKQVVGLTNRTYVPSVGSMDTLDHCYAMAKRADGLMGNCRSPVTTGGWWDSSRGVMWVGACDEHAGVLQEPVTVGGGTPPAA